MKTYIQILKDCISLNGINGYIAWKSDVIKEKYYDENGRPYTHTHSTYPRLKEIAAFGPFPHWDNTDPHATGYVKPLSFYSKKRN